MRFEITDGLGMVSIALSEIGSYFRCTRPLSVVWNDCRGSVGKYVSLLPSDPAFREQVRQRINNGLNKDYSNDIEELKTLLDPLLKLFPNGEYALCFYKPENYFRIQVNDQVLTQNWYMVNAEPVEKQNAKKLFEQHQKELTRHRTCGLFEADIMMYTTHGFYEATDAVFIATEDADSINPKRIKYFEEKIAKGERPFPIIFQSYFAGDENSIYYEGLHSDDYVLDGHHKLLAYANLKIQPPLAVITHLPKTRMEAAFNKEELKQALYPWQYDHIIGNWEEGYLYE
ncbi:MAG TPA: hypothetical protein VHM26_02480 [Chitinophagaceae bacterium]|jgi:hypothetical protein|nr:hypothetical protein [Chitinophagaceae bacterium]